jgi:hypothetical protein
MPAFLPALARPYICSREALQLVPVTWDAFIIETDIDATVAPGSDARKARRAIS